MRSTLVTGFACVAATLVFTACGGSDDAPATTAAAPAPTPTPSPSPSPSPSPAPSPTPAPAPTSTSTISGSAVKGPVSGATVTVKNAATGATVGTTTTTATGSYSLSVPNIGDAIVEVTGGSYVDEATGATTQMGSTTMRAVVVANGGAVTGVVTPLTTLAYTYALGSGSTVTSSGFNTASSALATQFKLTGVNLVNSVPVVTSGTTDPYGQVLRALSQYFKDNSVTLATYTGNTFTAAQWTTFTTTFNSAYKAANPTGTVSFSFDGAGLVVAGTGAGGGTGSCGVNVSGSTSASGFTIPFNANFCVTGLAGSCSADNATLSQGVAGQNGLVDVVNLKYTYSAACAAGATTITLK